MANGLLTQARRPAVFIPILAAILIGGFFMWRHFRSRESTDDAQVTGHVSPVAARVGGTVTAIKVADNQAVKAGDVLIEIDPRD